MQIAVAVKSDVGKVRAHNEDSFHLEAALHLYLVADGMGGHLGGKAASQAAVLAVAEEIRRAAAQLEQPLASIDLQQHTALAFMLADAVRVACRKVFMQAKKDPELHGMGTTITALWLYHGHAWIAQVGDSRCYLQRGDKLIQITDDHSLVNEQVKEGLLTVEAAKLSRLKNVVTRSVGYERDVAVDTFALALQPQDRFLLCSDGLPNMVQDIEIGRYLREMPLQEVPTNLIKLANERGGDDNVTVLVAEVESVL